MVEENVLILNAVQEYRRLTIYKLLDLEGELAWGAIYRVICCSAVHVECVIQNRGSVNFKLHGSSIFFQNNATYRVCSVVILADLWRVFLNLSVKSLTEDQILNLASERAVECIELVLWEAILCRENIGYWLCVICGDLSFYCDAYLLGHCRIRRSTFSLNFKFYSLNLVCWKVDLDFILWVRLHSLVYKSCWFLIFNAGGT